MFDTAHFDETKNLGFIWIQLKTENWKHCSKIIFKCVNSTVRSIFNEKVAEKWCLWCTGALFTLKSQQNQLKIKNKNWKCKMQETPTQETQSKLHLIAKSTENKGKN